MFHYSVRLVYVGLLLLAGTGLSARPVGENILENGDFSEKLEGWKVWKGQDYKGMDKKNSAVQKGKRGEPDFFRFHVPHRSAAGYLGLRQHVTVQEGTLYLLELETRHQDPKNRFNVNVSQRQQGLWTNNGLGVLLPESSEWKAHRILFKAQNIGAGEEGTDTPPGLSLAVGNCKGDVDILNLVLREWRGDPPVPIKPRGVRLEDTVVLPGEVDLSKPREWQSKQGSTLTAVFVSRQGPVILLRDPQTQRIIRLQMDQLAPQDQQMIQDSMTP